MGTINIKAYTEAVMAKAREAQKIYEAMASQELYDKAARAAAKAIYDAAEMLAVEAVEETQMGNVPDKIAKQRGLLTGQWAFAKGKKTTGVIGVEQGKLDKDCIITIAKPIGVICAVEPSTNPTATLAANCMQALKTGNAVVICSHPKAKNVSIHCTELIRDAIAEMGIPKDLVQCVEEPSLDMTSAFMSAADVVVATGGPSMVEAANSSGKPSFGVGQGNCQVCIDKGMSKEFEKLASLMVPNRSMDNAVMCTGEQGFILPSEDYDAFKKAFSMQNVMFVEDEAVIDRIRNVCFVPKADGNGMRLNAAMAGKSAKELGAVAELEVPDGVTLLICRIKSFGEAEMLCHEKLMPVSYVYTYEGEWKMAIDIAISNLNIEGIGHSTVVISDDKDNQLYAGLQLPVCRVIINNSDIAVGGGAYTYNGVSYDTGTVATSGVGCGFWQKNILCENFDFLRLLNYTRIIYTVEVDQIQTEEEVWSETAE
ncbi:aldehyde dehydrogenase family protein [Fusibacter paucivorans]|uniref:Aldehyde dehydrogenase family protein n=1 Tax=Fusibacter paucivorans TaxID=76009 RepID=A0ABS5PSS6_9FIRM|nr:aldehyde dehydrogenase family protein [Fusibacter paucivorans]MBS7527932.1 aldehyde dehydrogenase family protein [Fusibacter paucivorans]